MLEIDNRFHPYYTSDPREIGRADIIILPGTKNTLSDLRFLKERGLDSAIVGAYRNGKKVIGICGGYQMLGISLEDPGRIEGDIATMPGLGLLPLRTVITREKVTRQRRFAFLPVSHEMDCEGYEIHMGRTRPWQDAEERPLVRLEDGRSDGYFLDERCWGSYMHGILDNPAVLDYLATGLGAGTNARAVDDAAFKEEQYDKLAALVREHVDMDYIYASLSRP